MNATTVAAVRETAPGERRVALTPETVARLRAAGFAVLVEHGAGAAAWFADEAYAAAGAEVVSADEVDARAEVILAVGRPDPARLRAGQTLIGMLDASSDTAYLAALAARGVTAVSFEGLPRTLSRAQAMDALSSQANVAGYKAVLVAADAYDRYFPMLVTAAGTARPARVLVLGAGVAGLQAIGTARRLGAVVSAYDVRPEARGEVESVGGRFLALASVATAAGDGGYARALTADEREAQQRELADQVADHDVVITTARVPGRPPPLLVTAEAVKGMAAGSVVVDLAAGPLGGNVAGAEPGRTVVTDNGVTVIGAGDLAARVPAAASAAYARNVCALLRHLAPDGTVAIDLTDEIQVGVVVTHAGRVIRKDGAAS
jgi:NAD(P) transhydrogenase subunit alpha